FFLGLIVQACFSVTSVTLSAAAVLYGLNLIFTGLTGVYFFFDAGVSVSLFIGIHFLITDPATSPRTVTGKFMFGSVYALSVFATYALLGWFGAPQFYDKILCLPFLNLAVPWLDRTSTRLGERFSSAWLSNFSPRRTNFSFMALWSFLFFVMMST